MKDKQKKIIAMSLIGLVVGASLSMIGKIEANALGGVGGGNKAKNKLELIWDGVPAHLKYQAGVYPQQAYFTNLDPNHKNWYDDFATSKVSKESKARVFRQEYYGFTWYSPIPSGELTSYSKAKSYDQMYENYKEKNHYIVNWNRYLVSADNVSFKTKRIRPNDITHHNVSKGHTYNFTAPFKGHYGEWRYMGYSRYGDVIANPYFPADVPADKESLVDYGYETSPWGHVGDGQYSKWDNPYDAVNHPTKVNAIKKLISTYKEMQIHSTSWWVSRLSLRTDAEFESAVFHGVRNGGQFYRTLALSAPESARRNLRTVAYTIKDEKGKILATATRNSSDPYEDGYTVNKYVSEIKSGTNVTITAKVKNMLNTNSILDPSLFRFGYATGPNATTNDTDFSNNEKNFTGMKPGIYNGAKTKEFSWVTTVPYTNKIRFTGIIPQEHYNVSDNVNLTDDTVNIIFNVKNESKMEATKIQLINRQGNVVKNPLPGEDYKIRYYVKYTGPDVKDPIYKPRTGWYSDEKGNQYSYTYYEFTGWNYPKFDIPLESTIWRNIPPVHNYNETYKEMLYAYDQTVTSGKEFVFTTSDYRTYEVPIIKTTGQLKSLPGLTSYGVKMNSSISKEWKDNYDIRVENVKVIPLSERPVKADWQFFGVQFDIVSEAPSYVNTYETDVETLVSIGNATPLKYKEHVVKGKNQKITKEFKVWVDPSKDKEIYADVFANVNKHVWEKDLSTQTNNKGKSTGYILSPVSPFNGACSIGGQNTGNEWTQIYNQHSWNSDNKTYSAYYNTKWYRFYKYYGLTNSTSQIKQNETFKINKVLFRSKLTKDTKQGVNKDGWVDLTTGVAGQIKAGYGYELKMEVKYNTNAFTSQPVASINGGTGNWVRPINITQNIPSELFVKTPDGKILSVTGNNGTIQGLDVVKTGDRNSTVWTYTIKSKDTLGIKSVPKIFVDENTVDGKYNLQVFTPEINGVATKTSGSTLCDVKNVKIEVKGSATDDLNTHIVQ